MVTWMTIMKRTLLLRIAVICGILVGFVASALDAPLPPNFRVVLLPGSTGVVFTMYGAPGELGPLKQLVQVMREQQLGNGFDPGPTPHPSQKLVFDYLAGVGWPVMCYPGCADMQVKGGRCVLGPENEATLAAMDRAHLFTAIQLGEWGYYFHNLASNEPWWHDVYGKDFEQFKHLMKPAGLAGYDKRPTSRRECYEVLKDYFTSRSRDLLGRVISVTGHSHYEAYAGEWGARCIGLEVGENIAFTQSKFAFARGASRQWQVPWSVQVSPWFSGACTTSGPLRREGGGARGLDAGHSLSLYERLWLHAWFVGAAMVTPENSIAIFFEKAEAPWKLTFMAAKQRRCSNSCGRTTGACRLHQSRSCLITWPDTTATWTNRGAFWNLRRGIVRYATCSTTNCSLAAIIFISARTRKIPKPVTCGRPLTGRCSTRSLRARQQKCSPATRSSCWLATLTLTAHASVNSGLL